MSVLICHTAELRARAQEPRDGGPGPGAHENDVARQRPAPGPIGGSAETATGAAISAAPAQTAVADPQPLGKKVPGIVVESLKVVSVTTRSVQAITIGGEQFGLMLLATIVSDPVAWPLLTLKVPDADSDDLLAAFGWCAPGLMHSAVPETEMFTESRLLPSPASLNETVIELVPTFVTLA